MAPSTISPAGLGGEVAYYFTETLGIGVSGEFMFSGSPPPPSPSQWPLQQTAWSSELDVTSTFLSFPLGSLTLDLYATCGVGAISTRPVPVIEPSRVYPYSVSVEFAPALGFRLFATRSLTTSFEVRDAIYEGKTESKSTGTTVPLSAPNDAYGPNQLINRLELGIRVGYWI